MKSKSNPRPSIKVLHERNLMEYLSLFKKALKHYSRPVWLCNLIGYNCTHTGLCFYFENKHNILIGTRKFLVLEDYWIKYRNEMNLKSPYHFRTREDRIRVLGWVIRDIENEIKKNASKC